MNKHKPFFRSKSLENIKHLKRNSQQNVISSMFSRLQFYGMFSSWFAVLLAIVFQVQSSTSRVWGQPETKLFHTHKKTTKNSWAKDKLIYPVRWRPPLTPLKKLMPTILYSVASLFLLCVIKMFKSDLSYIRSRNIRCRMRGNQLV